MLMSEDDLQNRVGRSDVVLSKDYGDFLKQSHARSRQIKHGPRD